MGYDENWTSLPIKKTVKDRMRLCMKHPDISNGAKGSYSGFIDCLIDEVFKDYGKIKPIKYDSDIELDPATI